LWLLDTPTVTIPRLRVDRGLRIHADDLTALSLPQKHDHPNVGGLPRRIPEATGCRCAS
jgi:hypothetical protein